jgi:transmembrane sensor
MTMSHEVANAMNRLNELPTEPTPLEDEAYGWVMRFASGAASRDDIEALKRWSALSPAHAAAFDQASRTWQVLGPVGRELAEHDSAPVRGYAMRPVRAQLGRRAFLGGALAASAAGVALMGARPPLDLWPSWSELAADYRTNAGEQRQITLADHVSIDMNTRTSIAVGATGTEAQLVAGEALVATSQGMPKPFTLLAADGRVQATGARFNARIDGPTVYVTCIAGDVRIEHRAATLPLPAGQQLFYSDQEIGSPVAVDSAVVTAWQNGIVIFQGTPITEVIAEVNRYRPGRIILTNAELGRQRFNARFRSESIDKVVSQIEQVFGAKTTALPGGLLLLG